MKRLFAIFLLLTTPLWAGVDYDGSDDTVDLGNDSSIQVSVFTYSAWIKTSTSVNTNSHRSIFGSSTDNDGAQFRVESNETLVFNKQDQVNVGISTGTITNGQWHHVALTYDSSGNPAFVATGTSTHVLTSNGAGTAPTFQAAAGGGSDETTVVVTAGTGANGSTTLEVNAGTPVIVFTDGADENWVVSSPVPVGANGLTMNAVHLMYRDESASALVLRWNVDFVHYDNTAGGAITTDGGDVYVNAARLYEVDATDPKEAVDLVKARKGHLIRDTENPFPDLRINLDSLRIISDE